MLSQYVTDDNASPTANAVHRVLDALWECSPASAAVTPSPHFIEELTLVFRRVIG